MQARLMLHPTAFKCRNTTNLFANAHADKGSADEKSIRGRVPRAFLTAAKNSTGFQGFEIQGPCVKTS
jgi:hypothetical protein